MLITDGKIVTWEKPNQILEGQAIYIRDGIIAELGDEQMMLEKYASEERLNAHRQYIFPANICAHTHFYGAFARGLAIPGDAPADFPEILEKLWWRLDKTLDEEAVYYSALVCLVEAIKHGTTTLIDHHASPFAIPYSLDKIAEAVTQAGVRACLCYEVTDRDGLDKMEAGIRENMRFSESIQKSNPGGRLAAMFGLHASLTLSGATLEKCRAAAPAEMGFHVHVAEHSVDQYDSLKKSGMRVVDRLHRHHLLNEKSIAAHAVHVDAAEIGLLAGTKTWVTHQPRSNMNNAVGMSAAESMLRSGIKICMGNDGFSNAMWEEWKTAYLGHKVWNLDPRRMGGYDVIEMGVYNNQALVEALFGDRVGMIAVEAAADLIFVDYQPYTPLTAGNLPWHILFGFNESMITTTLAAGKLLMRDHKLTTLDEEKIAHEAIKQAEEVWKRFN